VAITIAGLVFALGVALIWRRIPPSWMYEPDGSALPRDPGVWRTAHVRLGWILCAVGVFLMARAIVT
jgi:hypothetical protein